jgi:hypothetical protein
MALDNISKFVGDVIEGHSLGLKKEPKKTGRQYGTTGLTYPLDMGVDAPAELDNHIIFDIYIDETTSFDTLKANTEPGEPTAYKVPAGQKRTTNVGQNVAESIGNDLNNLGNALESGAGKISETLGGLVGSFNEGTGKVVNEVFKGPRKMKKLNTSIALAVPNAFTSTSTANYSEAALGAAAGLYAGQGGISGLVNKFQSGGMDALADIGGDVARLGIETFAALPDAFGLNLRNIMEVSTRRVQNPHIEQRFDNVGFREFQFVYEMSARSKAEADAIDAIIKQFRFHMHPELVESGLYFMYPSLFDISVRFKEKENPYVHRISTCVLTSFTTNYTSTGVWSTNRDGQPTEIQITMTFREIEPMTKHRIAEGF